MTKEERREYNREYRKANKERIAEYYKANKDKIAEYYQTNKDMITEQQAEYRATPMGRAANLISSYRQEDKKYNRGECTLTAQWMVDNIFTSKCHWCGETDWTKLGCDRIDNSKPHTPDNVNPCCEECNKKRGTMDYYEFKKKWG